MTFLGDFRDFGSGVGLAAPIDAGWFRDVAGSIPGLPGTLRSGLRLVLIISQIFFASGDMIFLDFS